MRLEGVTDFQKRVFLALLKVPKGRVTTYKLLADHIGCGASRAVGQALKCNPFAPKVPCHRVIASDLTLGGFQGKREGSPIRKKRGMLEKEGIVFSKGKLVDRRQVYRF